MEPFVVPSLGSKYDDLIWNLDRLLGNQQKGQQMAALASWVGLACYSCGYCWPTLLASSSGAGMSGWGQGWGQVAQCQVADGQAVWALAQGRDCGSQVGWEKKGQAGPCSCSEPTAWLCPSWVCLTVRWAPGAQEEAMHLGQVWNLAGLWPQCWWTGV